MDPTEATHLSSLNPSAAGYDPGLTQTYTGTLKRVINENGQFNVRRAGRTWRDSHPYMYLINASWPAFSLIILIAFVIINVGFALLYNALGTEHIKGVEASTPALTFLNVFFFSAHTLTTVGYGNMYPDGPLANTVAALEALVGLMGFAIATGLLFGRFSRPSVRFGFSKTMLMAPYQGGTSLQFRVVNRRSNNLIEVEARLTLMTVEVLSGKAQRRYTPLDLERTQVLFLPLTWTIVHPIDKNSPLQGKTAEDLKLLQAELVVMMRGFDETFGQTVYARYSYRYDEVVWGAKFSAAFEVDKMGDMVLWVDKVSLTERRRAPGRGKIVFDPHSSECVFCKIVAAEFAAFIVYEDRDFIAFLDSHPLFPGHVLLCPREHYVTLLELPQRLAGTTMITVQLLAKAVESAVDAEGTFIAINNRVSQTVPHLHIHIVPRRRRDGLKGFFWPRQNYRDDAAREAVRDAIEREVQKLLT